MHPSEIEQCLDSLVCLIDTREQPTQKLEMRIRQIGYPIERIALNVGDYSAKLQLPNGEWKQLPVAIERKYDLAELCMCYCSQRKRFVKEFERAKIAQIKTYMLIEGATWEKIYSHAYRSKMLPQSLVGSILAWLSRYNCVLLFCRAETSGALIRDILWYESREMLMRMVDE